MTFESEKQPFCRSCGKPIRKYVDTLYFGRMAQNGEEHRAKVYPRSKAEVQTLVNGTVLSVSWQRYHGLPYEEIYIKETGGEYIDKVTVWDGVTYVDEFFCTLRCAADLGEAVAAQGWSMTPYRKAMGLE
ncbi:hypothetical protein CcrC1_gp264c [Caulobacter phage C1]|nr:hypothetical protein CcrC1_gp264c [Caulobacter phage C1]UTU08493.1 hypothetical protein CcrC2_gp265c [Caulobacter phage C2]UTU09008.1 hypothetical protein CcrJ4_gp259c [Caulobacter phage J4]UTU10126.1 hypothetical protein CcrRB23_gp264c [Caulobacter phage RB23]WGN97678.1 hypothetical protein [Bertelyvirus sp.]